VLHPPSKPLERVWPNPPRWDSSAAAASSDAPAYDKPMYDIVIIGAGPAGASAALFAAKAGKKTLVIDDDRSITKRARVRNHYGVLDITGPDLVELGKQQAVAFGAEVHRGTVTSIARIEGGFRIESANGTYEARHVLLATGLVVDVAENLGVVTKPGTEPRIKVVLEVDSAGRTNI